MIRRLKKIKNIGRFADYNNGPNCDFGYNTIIFGFNTQGKSTLTAILRSLQTGNNNILIGRKTFGAKDGKEIVVDFKNGTSDEKYTFKDRVWDKTNPNIIIFDSKFISENVFDGESITFDQQKNLNAIIIGPKGQGLNREIIALHKQSDDFANSKSEKTREFTRHFSNYDLDKFKVLQQDKNIDEKIKSKDKEIKFELEKEEIKKAIKNHIKSISSLQFSIRDSLAKTLSVKQKEIEEHIKSHFSTEKNARNFLSEGLNLLKEAPTKGLKRICVFCGQELDREAESLISLYSAYFKGGYQQLQAEVNNAIDYFKELDVGAILEKISADLVAKDLDVGLDEIKVKELTRLKKQFEKELDKKRDLNYAINFDAFDCLKVGIEKIGADLEELEQKKLNVSSKKSVSVLEDEKRVLEISQKRYTPIWIKFCDELKVNETEAEKVRKLREEKRKELDEYSSVVFDIHKETINRLCKDMGADFEIVDFRPLKKIIGTSERIFAIQFFHAHKVNVNSEDDKTPNFRNTLSESDKRLLAFAFFVSLLSHDRELDKKFVVFDDPMSSFDSERRRKTSHLIIDVACRYRDVHGTEVVLVPRQKIILTHEDRFAKDLSCLIPGVCTLKIEEYVDDKQKRSRIVRADFDQDFPDDDISYRIENIKNILDTRTFTTPFEADCREVLEHIFKRKYYLDLKEKISDKKSVRTFVTELAKKKINSFDDRLKSQKFDRLCNDLNIELHDGSHQISNGDKESIINDFFDCLKLI